MKARAWLALSALILVACSSDDSSVLEGCVDGVCPEGGQSPDPGIPFDPGGNGTQGDACASKAVTFEKRIPYVVLLVDQSGSMTEPFGSGTRWNVLHDALLDPGTGIVKKLEDEVRFGLALYTSFGGYDGGECPVLSKVDAQFGNYQAIKATYDAAEPQEDTPTGESLLAVANQLQKIYLSVPTPKVIVLATDGEPDTCEQPNPEEGQAESVAAAQAAYEMGIETYVISVGTDVGEAHLQDMANAGLGLPSEASSQFWVANDNGELYDAFDTIVNGVRECVFTLDGFVVPGYEDQGEVTFDGAQLAKDDPDGWKLNGANEIQLLGAACDEIQEGEHDLNIEFPCGGVVAEPK